MAADKKKPVIEGKVPSPKTAICKEGGCFDPAKLRGYCRLHFLKMCSGKSEVEAGSEKTDAGERRRSNRLMGPETTPVIDDAANDVIKERLSELDMDLDEVELDNVEALEPLKKAS